MGSPRLPPQGTPRDTPRGTPQDPPGLFPLGYPLGYPRGILPECPQGYPTYSPGGQGTITKVNLAWNDMRAADAAVLARGMDKGTTAILTPEGRVLTTLRVLDVSGNALTMARAGGRGGGRDAEEAAGLEHLAGLCQRKGIKLKNGEPAAGPKSPLERHFGPMAFCL